MTDYVTIALAEAKIGQTGTVWKLENGHRTWGQGGIVTALTPEVVMTVGSTMHSFDASRFGTDFELVAERPTDPRECVNFGPDCRGEVDWFDPSGRGRGAQRCGHHRDVRAEQYEDSIERYAYSAMPPSWFDPTYAGESWDEE